MPQFMLLLRDDRAGFANASSEEIQQTIQKYIAWRKSLSNQISAGHKLRDNEGFVLRKDNGKPLVTDGPFVESKEVMGGFFVIEAAGYEQALDLAKTCPHMEFGSIEVREVEPTANQANR